jgi:hypothetical protein
MIQASLPHATEWALHLAVYLRQELAPTGDLMRAANIKE